MHSGSLTCNTDRAIMHTTVVSLNHMQEVWIFQTLYSVWVKSRTGSSSDVIKNRLPGSVCSRRGIQPSAYAQANQLVGQCEHGPVPHYSYICFYMDLDHPSRCYTLAARPAVRIRPPVQLYPVFSTARYYFSSTSLLCVQINTYRYTEKHPFSSSLVLV